MKVQLESTTKVVTFEIDGALVPARVWEGETESGIPVHAYITRIAVPDTEDQSEFELELTQHRAPSPAIDALPPRSVL